MKKMQASAAFAVPRQVLRHLLAVDAEYGPSPLYACLWLFVDNDGLVLAF
jgi:hypothetical protein